MAEEQVVFGFHVHVGLSNREAAVQVMNHARVWLAPLLALSANSPFWDGADTRLASVRAKVFTLVPRSGLPPAFREWEDFEGYVDTLVGSWIIPDYSLCWWDARPHPSLGTVELRAPDAQTDAARTASLSALAQCLVATADHHRPEDPLLTEENKLRATRHGLEARLHDFSADRSVTAREAVRNLVEALRPISQDLECEAQLEGVLEIVEGGNGADKQRAVLLEDGSLQEVAAYLAATTV